MNQANSYLLEAWKAKLESQRQKIDEALSRKPGNPAFRERYVKIAESVVNNRKAWAEAYLNHVNSLSADLAGHGQVKKEQTKVPLETKVDEETNAPLGARAGSKGAFGEGS
jgi:hypothetical protein